jgi:hypothetical protein
MAAPASLARLAQIAALQRFVSLSADEQSCPTAILRNEGDRTVVVVDDDMDLINQTRLTEKRIWNGRSRRVNMN